MTSELDIHPASRDEQIEAYRNVHDVWGQGRSMEEHLAWRLDSVQHNRARWFVGTAGGEVVTGLGAYPLKFHLRGEMVEGFSIGSVHTRADHRRRGLAAQLIAWVERHLAERGAKLAMLYSDIAPHYYARLGYQLCPAHEGWTRTDGIEAESDDAWRLEPFPIEDDLLAVDAMYAGYHGRLPVAVAREDDYWRFTLRLSPDDTFCWLVAPGGERCGYVRLARSAGRLSLADWALARPGAELERALYRQVLRWAAGQEGVEEVGGWMPASEITRTLFSVRPRSMEITMLKGLDPGIALDEETLAGADRFCAIDHV